MCYRRELMAYTAVVVVQPINDKPEFAYLLGRLINSQSPVVTRSPRQSFTGRRLNDDNNMRSRKLINERLCWVIERTIRRHYLSPAENVYT